MKLDPNDFIITRKRKKYRFAHFANLDNCYELDEWRPLSPGTPITIEIGAGNGLFAVELASRHPERQFIALDVKGDRLQRGAREAETRGLTNISFVRSRADQLLEVCAPDTVDEIWLTFSDPFPKKRAAKHRLTHPRFLSLYREIMHTGGQLLVKHDNPKFFAWSLEQLVQDKWNLTELSFDLHDSELSEEYKIMTTYEKRWLAEGGIINFVRAEI